MNPTRERLRLIAQVALLVAAAAAAAAAAWRYQVTRSVAGTPRPRGPAILATPSSGPAGVRPMLQLYGFRGSALVRVLFCVPDSSPSECAELGSGRPSEQVRGTPIPRALTVGGATRPVTPGKYQLRAVVAGDATARVRGTFVVVAFAIGSPPQARSFAGLDTARLTLGTPTDVARGVSCAPRFTPDNRLILGGSLLDPRTLITVELGVSAAELSWSPSRDRLAIVTDDRKEIRMAAPDGGDQVVVVREARGLLSSVTWSPDAAHLAYVVRPQAGVRGASVTRPTVMLLDLTAGAKTAVTPGEAVAWSPLTDRLAVEVREGAASAIRVVGPDGNGPRLVDGRNPAWSPDGRLVAFIRPARGDAGPGWVTRSDGPAPALVVTAEACGMAFSPDGKWMAVVLESQGSTRLVMRPITTGR